MIDAILKKYKHSFLRVIDYDYHSESLVILDLTKNNNDLNSFDVNDAREFSFYIKKKLIAAKSRIGIGLYLEDRDIYRSDLFAGTCARTVH